MPTAFHTNEITEIFFESLPIFFGNKMSFSLQRKLVGNLSDFPSGLVRMDGLTTETNMHKGFSPTPKPQELSK